jgi:hypothetical protein
MFCCIQTWARNQNSKGVIEMNIEDLEKLAEEHQAKAK